MKTLLLIRLPLVFTLIPAAETFFAKLFDYGDQSSNCIRWSLWSPCFTTEQRNMFMRVPANCMYSGYLAPFVQNGGIHTMDLAYKWLKKVNQSGSACGMCSFQISCSRPCDIFSGPDQAPMVSQDFFPGQQSVNHYGISQRPCEGVDQTDACIADPNESWDPVTGMCQMWPPIRDQAMPDTVGPTKQQLQYSVPPTPCIL